jgi:hypothetical protein
MCSITITRLNCSSRWGTRVTRPRGEGARLRAPYQLDLYDGDGETPEHFFNRTKYSSSGNNKCNE